MNEDMFDFENSKADQKSLEYVRFCIELSRMINGLMKIFEKQ